ncbi:MAG TPA: hypothetical protein VLF89_06665 [Candidatus Saccharimonadales bacterium]|nr:hypothetical protein [Candidatus Saccharimonadales bacterium]HSW97479.1 hypothetical protein [Candidatus Saccharimonadales bacterium]
MSEFDSFSSEKADLKPYTINSVLQKQQNNSDSNKLDAKPPIETKRLEELRTDLSQLLHGSVIKNSGTISSDKQTIDLPEWAIPEELKNKSNDDQIIHEDADVIKDGLEKRQIFDYEPCILNEKEKEKLLTDITKALTGSSDTQRITLLKELYKHIDKSGKVFTEFSHGTGSLILKEILSKGLLPWESINTGESIYGEGTMSVEREEGLHRISVGVGQGGLGTAIAYAEMTENPYWNLRIYNPALYSDYRYQKTLKEQLKNDSFSQEDKMKMRNALQDIQGKLSNALGEEYPLVVGFDQSEEVKNILDPKLEIQTQLISESPYFDKSQLTNSIDKTNIGQLDSEAQLPKQDKVIPSRITMLSCPSANIVDLKSKIQNENISIISFEALELLSEFGLLRIKTAHKFASSLLHENSTGTFSKRYLEWRRKENKSK